MGKAGRVEQQAFPDSAPATATATRSRSRSSRCRCGAVVEKVVNGKCVSVLFLAVSGFLSAFFLLLHLQASGDIPDDPGILAEIEAGFILSVPHSQVASQAEMLEDEIYAQIGVPNSTVSVSMQPYICDTTYVKFGVLPDPRNTSMSTQSINALKASLINLTLHQQNLSLTPSVFGETFCLEILGFPGGITVLLPHNASHADSRQPLFNIMLNSTIHEIREFLKEMKTELGSTLEQTRHEELYVELTNTNGSTVETPVTVQVFISPIDHSSYLGPHRLEQLSKIITECSARNLGLNISIFGKIIDLTLSPLLQAFVPSYTPSMSPTSTPSLPWSPTSEHRKTYPYREISCPPLVKIQNETTQHRRLMHVSSKTISPQLSTQFHRKYKSEGKKNNIAVAATTFTAPAPNPK